MKSVLIPPLSQSAPLHTTEGTVSILWVGAHRHPRHQKCGSKVYQLEVQAPRPATKGMRQTILICTECRKQVKPSEVS